MTRVARVMLPCLVALLLGALALAPAPTRAETQPASEKTYDAPPALLDTGRLLRDLFKQEKFDDIHAICEQGYRQATNDEARAFFLHKAADAYVAQGDRRGLDLLYQVLARFPATMQAPLVILDLADLDLEQAEKAKDPDTKRQLALRALATLDHFLATYPGHERVPRALWKRGMCCKLLEEWEAMLADYQYVADVYPTSPWTHVCLEWVVKLKQSQQAHDEAILDARAYLQLYPDKYPGYAQYLIGRSVLAQGDEKRALAEFDKAMALTRPGETEQAAILHLVATQMLAARRYDDVHILLRPILTDPNPAFDKWREISHYLDGYAYYRAGDYANALAIFRALEAAEHNAVDKAAMRDLIREVEKAAAQ